MDAPSLGAMTDDQTSKLVGPVSVRFHHTPREGDVSNKSSSAAPVDDFTARTASFRSLSCFRATVTVSI